MGCLKLEGRHEGTGDAPRQHLFRSEAVVARKVHHAKVLKHFGRHSFAKAQKYAACNPNRTLQMAPAASLTFVLDAVVLVVVLMAEP